MPRFRPARDETLGGENADGFAISRARHGHLARSIRSRCPTSRRARFGRTRSRRRARERCCVPWSRSLERVVRLRARGLAARHCRRGSRVLHTHHELRGAAGAKERVCGGAQAGLECGAMERMPQEDHRVADDSSDVVRCACRTRAVLGEGPLWVARENAVYWVDIKGRALHRLSLRDDVHTTWSMPEMLGWIVERRAGPGFIAGFKSGIRSLVSRSVADRADGLSGKTPPRIVA